MGPRHLRAVDWLKKKGARIFSLSDNMAAQKQRNCKIIFDSGVLLVFFKGWLARLVSDD